jgi:hypothetical protein
MKRLGFAPAGNLCPLFFCLDRMVAVPAADFRHWVLRHRFELHQ